jgi:glycosyltransferase involved in cell wall biosynthesis
LVTVVTPVWNGERTLARALASVAGQTYPAIEHIIIDGGSRDATLEILGAAARPPGLWLSEPDAGLYDAINKGIALASGQYVKILNADDVLPLDSVEIAMRAAASVTGDHCIRGDLAITDDDDRVLKVVTRETRPWFLPEFFPILHPSWYLPTAVYARLGLYSTEYRVAADWEYFLRLHAAGVPILHVDQVLAQFRRGGLSGGYGGLPEGFEINARYLGRRQAAVILACMSSMKAASRLLQRLRR